MEKKLTKRKLTQKIVFGILALFLLASLAALGIIIFFIFQRGIGIISLDFLLSMPKNGMTEGGILPTIIRASEEALMAVPDEYRSSSLALGATKWQTIKNVVLPAALPGILTGCILGVGRVAGETAPIIFTAATFFSMRLPKSIFSEVMALPYNIYALVSTGTFPAKQEPIAYGSAVVLLTLVLLINLIAIIMRIKFSKKIED